MFSIDQLIKAKQSGSAHSKEEIEFIVNSYSDDKISDSEMSMWLRAVYSNNMDYNEAVCYTESIINSGKRLNFKDFNGYVIDKHSTGGVGDKVSLILGPILAACGCYVPMIVGRALGHTGGTLDKLESIPGYNGLISLGNFKNIVNTTGISIIGQTDEICPADKKIYKLRGLTDTIDSFPLICGSIMGKKIAEGIQGLVLDIKTGNGAFMRGRKEADALGKYLQLMGNEYHIDVDYCVTDMNQPLGVFSGLLCEVIESMEFLKGSSDDDLLKLIYHLGEVSLKMAGVNESKKSIDTVIRDGSAYEILCKMIYEHGGDVEKIKLDPEEMVYVEAKKNGFINYNNTKGLGLSILALSDNIKSTNSFDPQSGFKLFKKEGDFVRRGDKVAKIFCTNKQFLDDGVEIFNNSFDVLDIKGPTPNLIY